jgi:hypothetical protein
MLADSTSVPGKVDLNFYLYMLPRKHFTLSTTLPKTTEKPSYHNI